MPSNRIQSISGNALDLTRKAQGFNSGIQVKFLHAGKTSCPIQATVGIFEVSFVQVQLYAASSTNSSKTWARASEENTLEQTKF